MFISHLLFIDDVIIIGGYSSEDWKNMHCIIVLFCNAFGLEVNCRKSFILHLCKVQSIIDSMCALFPFNAGYIDEGVRYLGFHLKPSGYGPKYWVLFRKDINWKIDGWYARYLSLGGIFLLASLVLQGILVIFFPSWVTLDIHYCFFKSLLILNIWDYSSFSLFFSTTKFLYTKHTLKLGKEMQKRIKVDIL